MIIKHIRQASILLILILLISGCSVKGYTYKPDYTLRGEVIDSNLKSLSVERSTLNNSNESISLRAINMTSPYGGSFSRYLEIALEEQLKLSSIYDKNSTIKISTILLKNNVDISGISIGQANLAAKFTIIDNGKKIYDKTHTIHHTWDSSFLGQIAIENAKINYPIAIQKLINKFLMDNDFINVVKNQ